MYCWRYLTIITAAVFALQACGDDDSTTSTPSDDAPEVNVDAGGVSDVETSPEDISSIPSDTDQVDDSPSDAENDAFLEDGFTRPDTPMMPDTPLPGETLEGSQDCFRYILETQSTVFTLKLDNFFVAYEIRNQCNRPIRVRTQHFSDMFPVGLQKDGEPWLFFPDCPGTGEPVERVLNPGDGWRRGWFWRADDHESRLEQCGLEFDPDAQYSLIGFGLTEVPPTGSDVWSEIFPLTDPIDITLITR